MVAVAAVAALAALWSVVLPEWRPSLRDGERLGVDVSHHQGVVDWEAVAADGIGFVYLKATEGGDWVDPRFVANWSGAGRVGLDRGAYHFFTFCRSGAEQAANFLQTVPPGAGELPPAVDVELAGNCGARPPAEWVEHEVGVFVETVEAARGEPVILYTVGEVEEEYRLDHLSGGGRWVRRLLVRPASDDWVLWQATSKARVDGIDGPVDLDVGRR